MKRLLLAMACILAIFAPLSTVAADTPTNIGLAAGLGLTAATGKNSVSNGGGATEAGILNTEAFLKAGIEIRRLARIEAKAHPVLVLGHADTLDLSEARYVAWRVKTLKAYIDENKACSDKPLTAAEKAAKEKAEAAHSNDFSATVQFKNLNGTYSKLSPPDAVAALATDMDVQGITLNLDDRMLVDAVIMGTTHRTRWYQPGELTEDRIDLKASKADGGEFKSPGDLADLDIDGTIPNGLLTDFNALAVWAQTNAKCNALKDKVAEVNSFVSSALSSDKGPAPIVNAAQLSVLWPQNGDLAREPYVLRVAIEQQGGTAVTRSNIWYELGYPGAVQIAGGFIASFRLIDPQDATPLLTGMVRCMIKPTNLSDVKKKVDEASAGSLPTAAADATIDQSVVPTPQHPVRHLSEEELAQQQFTCSVAASAANS